MIKSELLSHINKYYLGGMIDPIGTSNGGVVWNINENIAVIKFLSAVNSTAGELIFPFETSEQDPIEIGVHNTKALIGLLNIMQDDVSLQFEKEYGIWMKLNINDGVYEGSYSLADIRSIPTAPDVEEPKTFEVSFPLDKEFKDQFLKAHKALGSINRFTIQTTKKDIKFTLGNKESYANKVSFNKACDDFLPITPKSFSGEAMAEILKNNPDLSESTLEVSAEGLMKIVIFGGDDKVTYYLIELEEV